MGAQPSRQSPQPHALSEKGNHLLALIGMGLALLSLLCAVIAAMRGANLFLSLLIGVIVIRLFALCYGSLQTSSSSNSGQSVSPTATPSGQSFTSDMSTGSPTFAASAFTANAAPSFYPQNTLHESHEPYKPYTPFNTPQQSAGYNSNTRDVSYNPIEQDELFQLDVPMMGEYVLYMPQEGKALVDCQDRFALNARRGRYAIADGVGGSFVPASWARIVARGFVEYELDERRTVAMLSQGQGMVDEHSTSEYFGERGQFEQWLQQCRNQWQGWIRGRWVPAINASRMQHGDSPLNWESEIERGAQTTLTGCWLRPRANPSDPYIDVNVSVIGDSEFFLFRRNEQGAWQNIAALPFISVDEFDNRPAVLTTRPEGGFVESVWTQRQEGSTAALPGDRIVLTTAPLAKWILMQVQQQRTEWTALLEITSATLHEQILRNEQHLNRLGNDDVTMLVIPVLHRA